MEPQETIVLEFFGENGTYIASATYTSNETKAFTVPPTEVEYVHLYAPGAALALFSFDITALSQTLLSLSDKPVSEDYSMIEFIPPATETYSFTATQNYAVRVWDSTGSLVSVNGPTILTVSETYYLVLYNNGESANDPEEITITVTVCSTDYTWDAAASECRLTICVDDPNSDGTDDGSDNCNCNSGFLWNSMIETCTMDCTGDTNADGNAGPTTD